MPITNSNSNPIAGNPIVAYGGGAVSIEDRVDSLETNYRKKDIASCQLGSGAAYCYVVQIVVTGAYQDESVALLISRRSRPMAWVEIRFVNANSTDPALAAFKYSSTETSDEFYIIKSSAGTWRLYCKTVTYDDVRILDTNIPINGNTPTVNIIMTRQETALSWTAIATKG